MKYLVIAVGILSVGCNAQLFGLPLFSVPNFHANGQFGVPPLPSNPIIAPNRLFNPIVQTPVIPKAPINPAPIIANSNIVQNNGLFGLPIGTVSNTFAQTSNSLFGGLLSNQNVQSNAQLAGPVISNPNVQSASTILNGVLQNISNITNNFVYAGNASSLLAQISAALGDSFNKIGAIVQGISTVGISANLLNAVSTAVNTIQSSLSNLIQTLVATTNNKSSNLSNVEAAVATLLGGTKSLIQAIGSIVANASSQLSASTQQDLFILQLILQNITAINNKVLTFTNNLLSSLGKLVSSFLFTAQSSILNLSVIVNGIVSSLSYSINFAGNLQQVAQSLNGLVASLSNLLSGVVGAAVNVVSGVVAPVLIGVTGIIGTATNTVVNTVGTVVSTVDNSLFIIFKNLQGIIGSIFGQVNVMIKNVSATVSGVLGKVDVAFTDLINAIHGIISIIAGINQKAVDYANNPEGLTDITDAALYKVAGTLKAFIDSIIYVAKNSSPTPDQFNQLNEIVKTGNAVVGNTMGYVSDLFKIIEAGNVPQLMDTLKQTLSGLVNKVNDINKNLANTLSNSAEATVAATLNYATASDNAKVVSIL